jgi:hypothetical protein
MYKVASAAACALIFCSSVAGAVVFGGSNLGPFGYPSHQCNPPYSKPIEPYQFESQWEVDSYNLEVERYNQELEGFIECVREYIENADNDVRRIQEKTDEAIRDAQSL